MNNPFWIKQKVLVRNNDFILQGNIYKIEENSIFVDTKQGCLKREVSQVLSSTINLNVSHIKITECARWGLNPDYIFDFFQVPKDLGPKSKEDTQSIDPSRLRMKEKPTTRDFDKIKPTMLPLYTYPGEYTADVNRELAETEIKHIAVDLDGTLAYYDSWKGIEHIGQPIQPTVDAINAWLESGHKVTLFTARAGQAEAIPYIRKYLDDLGFQDVDITNVKLVDFTEFYDDRAFHVVPNEGI